MFWVENHESFGVFFDFAPKIFLGSQLHRVCMRRNGTSTFDAVDAVFSHFCYAGGFGDLGDSVVPTLRGVNGDVVTVYAY